MRFSLSRSASASGSALAANSIAVLLTQVGRRLEIPVHYRVQAEDISLTCFNALDLFCALKLIEPRVR